MFMAVEQILPIEIGDAEPHDYLFHMPDQRASYVTLWVDNTQGSDMYQNLDPKILTVSVIMRSVVPEHALRVFRLDGGLFKSELSLDGNTLLVYNPSQIFGWSDIGLRLQYATAPDPIALGTVAMLAWIEAGKI